MDNDSFRVEGLQRFARKLLQAPQHHCSRPTPALQWEMSQRTQKADLALIPKCLQVPRRLVHANSQPGECHSSRSQEVPQAVPDCSAPTAAACGGCRIQHRCVLFTRSMGLKLHLKSLLALAETGSEHI